MYNRYIPTPDGGYRKTVMDAEPQSTPEIGTPTGAAEADPICGAAAPAASGDCLPCAPGLRLPKLETRDWLVLLILLLLLTDGEGADLPSILVAAAVFLFF